MNQKFLFEGKTIDEGILIEGYYVKAEYDENTAHLIYVNLVDIKSGIKISHPYEVAESSVRQIKPVEGWVSVEDRLPENENDVLAYVFYEKCANEEIIIIWRNMTTLNWMSERTLDVTYWMPLPEPPKEK